MKTVTTLRRFLATVGFLTLVACGPGGPVSTSGTAAGSGGSGGGGTGGNGGGSGGACSAVQCDDNNKCTDDKCRFTGVCEHDSVTNGSICQGSFADPIHGECMDGICDITEWTCYHNPVGTMCIGGRCVAQPIICDGGVCGHEPLCCTGCTAADGSCSFDFGILGGAACP